MKLNKFLAVFLCVAMVFGVMTFSASALEFEYYESVDSDFEVEAEEATAALLSDEQPSENWIEDADTSWYSEDGTDFEIGTAEELAGLAKLVNEGTAFHNANFVTKTITLTDDIDLDGKMWTPIGNAGGDRGKDNGFFPFMGTFDGNEFTISNVSVYDTNEPNLKYANLGLFGSIGKYGDAPITTVKNLTVNNAKVITSQITSQLGSNVAAVIGNANASTVITNVHLTGTVEIEGWSFIGGIVGHGYPQMSDCSVEAEGTIHAYQWCCGALVGYLGEGADVYDSSVIGTNDGLAISTEMAGVGGAVGRTNGGSTVDNITVENVVISTDEYYVNAGYGAGYVASGADVPTNSVIANVVAKSEDGEVLTPDDTENISVTVAKIGDVPFTTLKDAVKAAEDGDTIYLFGIIEEGSIKLPAVIRNLTIDGQNTAVVKNTVINAADGGSVDYQGLTIKNTTFDNSRFVLGGMRSGNVIYKDLVFDNNTFKNIVDNASMAAVHMNVGSEDNEYIENFRFVNNTIDGVSGSSNSGVLIKNAKGDTVFDNNVIKNVYNNAIQCINAKADINLVITNNELSSEAGGIVNLYTLTKVTFEGNTVAPFEGQQVLGNFAEVAEVDGVYYTDFITALKAVKADSVLNLLDNVTITDAKWDNRNNGAKITVPFTFNGNENTLKINSLIDDGYNHWSVFRVESDATFKNLTIDVSEATASWKNQLNVISSKDGDLTVENCIFIGNTTDTKGWAVIYGQGENAATETNITVSGCNFENFRYGVSDNQNGGTVATVTVENSTFTNSSINVSASDEVVVTGNTVEGGFVKITSYDVPNELEITATGNTLDEEFAAETFASGAVLNVQEGFLTPAADLDGVKYFDVSKAIAAIGDDSVLTIGEGTYDVVLDITEKNVTVKADGEVKFTKAPKLKGTDWYVEGIDFEYADGGNILNCDGTLEDCTFTSAGNTVRYAYGDNKNAEQTLTIDGCTFITGNPTNNWALHFDQTYGADIIIVDSAFDGRFAVTGDHKSMGVSGTEFTGKYANTYNDVTYTDCTFDVEYVYTGGGNVVVEFENCKVVNEEGEEVEFTMDILYNKQSTVFVDGNLETGAFTVNDVVYGKLQEAIDATNGNGTVVLTGDVWATATVKAPAASQVSLMAENEVVIDLAGYTLNGYLTVENGATAVITNGTIKNTNANYSAILSLGTTTIENVAITSARHAVRVENGTTTINNCNLNVSGTAGMTTHAVNVGEEGNVATVVINGGTFTGPAGTQADSGSAVNVKAGSTVTINSGKFSGGKNSTLASNGTLVVNSGLFDQAVDASYIAATSEAVDMGAYDYPYGVAPKAASAIKVVLDETDNKNVYDIKLVSNDGLELYEFVVAELTFKNESTTVGGGAMEYRIDGVEGKTVVDPAAKDEYNNDQYLIHIPDGAVAYRLSGTEFVIGQVTFFGQGAIKFSVLNGEVDTTWQNTNLGRYYSVADSTLVLDDDAVIDSTVSEIKRNVAVNIAFNHNIDTANYWGDYQITATLKNNFGYNVTKNISINDVKSGTCVFEEVPLGAITVTLEAPGFRTYPHKTVVEETEDNGVLVLNFWNDVKRSGDEAIETGKKTMAHNFLAGDIVMDYTVDKYDLAAVTSYYGTYGIDTAEAEKYLKYDLNRDGDIDIRDVQYVLHTMGN